MTDQDLFANAKNVELESAVIAVLLDGRHANAYGILQEHCPEVDAFTTRNHKIVIWSMHQLGSNNIAIDGASVADYLSRCPFQRAMDKLQPVKRRFGRGDRAYVMPSPYEDSALAGIGGNNALSDMATVLSPAKALERNCKLLMRYLRQRRQIVILRDMTLRAQSHDGSTEIESIASDTMNSLMQSIGKGRVTSSAHDGMVKNLEAHDQAAALYAAGQKPLLASWGVQELDRLCPLAPGRLIVLAALPGCGKTSLLLQSATATRNMHGGQSVRLISYDMPIKDLSAVLMSRAIGVPKLCMLRGWMTAEQRTKYVDAQALWKDNDIQMMGRGPETTMSDVIAWIRMQHRLADGKLLVVGIDYVQQLPGNGREEKEYERINRASSALIQLRDELGICIIALSQFNNEVTKEKRRPRLSDLRGSGQLGQDADAVVFLFSDKPKDDTMLVECIVDKNRGYKTGTVELMFHRRAGQEFKPIEQPEQTPVETTMPGDLGPNRGQKMFSEPKEGEGHAFDA